MNTSTKDAFSLGVFNSRTNQYSGFNFAEGKDTLGLLRTGATSDLKIRLDQIITDDNMANLADLKFACKGVDEKSITIRNIELKEINYRSGTQKALIVIAILAVIFFLLTFSLPGKK